MKRLLIVALCGIMFVGIHYTTKISNKEATIVAEQSTDSNDENKNEERDVLVDNKTETKNNTEAEVAADAESPDADTTSADNTNTQSSTTPKNTASTYNTDVSSNVSNNTLTPSNSNSGTIDKPAVAQTPKEAVKPSIPSTKPVYTTEPVEKKYDDSSEKQEQAEREALEKQLQAEREALAKEQEEANKALEELEKALEQQRKEEEERKKALQNTEMQYLSKEEQEVFNKLNSLRASLGLSKLTFDSKMNQAARYKSKDMLVNKYYAHVSPSGAGPSDVLRKFGVSFTACGENINRIVHATYDSNISGTYIFDSWRNSSGHYNNMVNADFTKVSIGIVKQVIDGTTYYYATMLLAF